MPYFLLIASASQEGKQMAQSVITKMLDIILNAYQVLGSTQGEILLVPLYR